MKCWFVILALSLAGCAAYRADPISPALTEARFRSRSLSDPALAAYLNSCAPTTALASHPATWNLSTLTLVALYYHPDLDVARAKAAAAEAGITTAGQQPNPNLTVTPQYNTPLEEGLTSPWTFGFGLDIPIETAGKRGYRIAQAKAISESTRLEVAQVAWQVRSRLRAALMAHLFTSRDLQLLRAEEAARSQALVLLERQLAAGQASVVEVDIARINLDSVRVSIRAAEGRVAETRAALAAAAGVPVGALEGVVLDASDLDNLPKPDAIPPATLQRAGLLNRLDMRRLLAEYAAVEAALQLQVAKQYPDIRLVGPGYQWDQGVDKYAVGLSLELPVFNRNQGPIGEALARRKEAAARFLALQAQVIGQTEQAAARYQAAFAELTEAQHLAAVQDRRFQSVHRSVEIGEKDALMLASAQVQSVVAARSRLAALRKAQAALGELEDAVQRPLGERQTMPAVPTTGPRDDGRKEVTP